MQKSIDFEKSESEPNKEVTPTKKPEPKKEAEGQFFSKTQFSQKMAELNANSSIIELIVSLHKTGIDPKKVGESIREKNINISETLEEFQKFLGDHPDKITLSSPEDQKSAEHTICQILAHHMDAETLSLVLRGGIKVKDNHEKNMTGYDEIASFDPKSGTINLSPELFNGKFEQNYVIIHEIGHAITMSPGVLYSEADLKNFYESLENGESGELPAEMQDMIKMVNNPEKYIGSQGQWIDLRLKELADDNALKKLWETEKLSFPKFSKFKTFKKSQVLAEIMADRAAAFLASDGTEEAMLFKFIERFSAAEVKNILGGFSKELAKDHPAIQSIINENHNFYIAFKKRFGKDNLGKLKTDLTSASLVLEEDIDDLNEVTGDTYSQPVSEPSKIGYSGNKKSESSDPLGWLWSILAPASKA